MTENRKSNLSGQGNHNHGQIDRKNFFRIVAGVTTGLFAARPVLQSRARGITLPTMVKVSVTSSCLGCTGCVAVCPVSAIAAGPGTIIIDNKKCVSCGYCAALCPVKGVHINRIDTNE